MKVAFALASLGAAAVSAKPLEARQYSNKPQNPIKSASAQLLGNQVASNSCSGRDLGFVGQIGGSWFAQWGDVLWCSEGVTDPDKTEQGFHGMVRDAVSKLGDDPLKVEDLHLNDDKPVAHQLQFVPFKEEWGETSSTGFGGTGIAETTPGTGVVYYLVNQNDAGLVGAGAGKVEMQNGTPTVTQRYGDNGIWWKSDSNPRYGDQMTYRDDKSGYIYAFGGSPTKDAHGDNSNNVYLTRVKFADAFDLTKYEYWWGARKKWKSDLLTTFTKDTAVFTDGEGQGQMVWSDKYKVYIFAHMAFGGALQLKVANAPEGPWSDDVHVYDAKAKGGGMVYAPCLHPYLDPSGNTLTISYTNNNHIEVIKATI